MSDTSGIPSVEAALSYADGYKAALDDCDRADVAKLIEKIDGLEGRLSFEKALRSIAERNTEHMAKRIVELEDEVRSLKKAVLGCTTLSEQSNAIVVDAKTVAKLREPLVR